MTYKVLVIIFHTLTEKFRGKISLANIMREVAPIIGGTGGGHSAAAGANGTREDKIGDALKKCVEIVLEEV